MAEQQLAHGQTMAGKWAGLGGVRGRIQNSPLAIKALLVGMPDTGKSTLLQGCPEMFLMNLDRFSTTNPDPQSTNWPVWDQQTGHVLGDDGKPTVLTFEMVEKKVEQLIKLALENKPRPTLVGIDTLTALLRLVREHIVTHAVEIGLSSVAVDEWPKLNGLSAYDWAYNRIVRIISDLSNAGYGVYGVTHLANEVVQIGDDRSKVVPTLVFTAGFWKRLFDIFELIVVLERRRGERTESVLNTITLPDGKVLQQPGSKTVRFDEVWMVTARAEFGDGITKRKLNLPDIKLPLKGGWEEFISQYKAAQANS